MKALLSFIIVILSSAAGYADDFLKVTVTGTVRTQIVLTQSDGRILSKPLNNQRIAQEFLVLLKDYRLVLNTTTFELQLVPIRASSMQPTFTVAKFEAPSAVVTTKSRLYAFSGPISSDATGKLFEGLAGEAFGNVTYTGAFPPSVFTRGVITVAARGKDTTGGNSTALLNFKVILNGKFTQLP
jgi:hypothetical protein